MTSKERIHALLSGEIPDRIGKADAPWPETRARWHNEGLPEDEHPNDLFGMDVRMMLKLDHTFRLPETVEEEGDDYQIVRTSEGVLTKCWKSTGAPQMIEYALRTPDDWKKLRGRLVPSTDRIGYGYYGNYTFEYVLAPFDKVKETYADCPNRETTFVCMEVLDPYEAIMSKMGDEELLMNLALEPDWCADMFDAHVTLVEGMTERVFAEGFRPDGVFIGGDIAYRNGLLFSPAIYRDLLLPRLVRMIRCFKDHDLKVIYHTDGDCREAIPMLIEAGIDCLQPLEVKAGLDVRQLAEAYGDRIAFMGNLDVRALSGDETAVRAEVETKVRAMTAGRFRYIAHSDHSIPDTVPFSNYQLAMDIIDELGWY